MLLMPRETGKLIAKLAKSVFIEDHGVQNTAFEFLKSIKNGSFATSNFSQLSFHPDANDCKALDWIFVIDTLNFSFWGDNDRWMVNKHSGYFALCSAIKRAIQEGIPFTDPQYYSKMELKDLKEIFRPDEGSVEIPMIKERLNNLHQVGKILIEKYNGSFEECVKRCGNSAEKLLKLIVEDFECFRDEAFYDGNKVSFYKRAQILVGDIWTCFKGTGFGKFNDIGVLTMFADYRVPQVLVYFGAMRYSKSLAEKLKSEGMLQANSEEEIEIRGCSIEIVERVLIEVNKLLKQDASSLKDVMVNSIVVDHFLWDYRRAHAEDLESIPYHKTRTIYY